MLEQPTVKLEQEQIKKAAKLGVTLLTRPGAINIPSHLALSGEVQTLHIILRGVAGGQLMIVPQVEEQPGGEVVDDK